MPLEPYGYPLALYCVPRLLAPPLSGVQTVAWLTFRVASLNAYEQRIKAAKKPRQDGLRLATRGTSKRAAAGKPTSETRSATATVSNPTRAGPDRKVAHPGAVLDRMAFHRIEEQLAVLGAVPSRSRTLLRLIPSCRSRGPWQRLSGLLRGSSS